MTFEEWFKENIDTTDLDSETQWSMYRSCELAWQAGYQAGGSAEVEWQAYLDRIDD